MAASKEQLQYIRDYKREHVERVYIEIPKGKKQDIKAIAEQHNKSVTRLIVDALETQYKIDLSKE